MPQPTNIARHLPDMARSRPEAPAIKIPTGRHSGTSLDYLQLSFAELETEAALWQNRLRKAGIKRGDRTLVMVRPGLPLIACIFALFAEGTVPVVIDPGMGLKSFLACVGRSRPDALVGIPMANVISRLAWRSFKTVRKRLTASGSLTSQLGGGLPHRSLEIESTEAHDLAAILFTSGSTGAPKGVCYEHGMFESQVSLVQQTYDIKPGEVDMPLLPVFALFNPALGMTTVVPDLNPSRPASMKPAAMVQAIIQEKVTNSFGSPTLWGMIADYCVENAITLPSIKRVLCAGAPVPARLWEQSRHFLPNGKLHSPYGATEALPVSSIDATQADFTTLKGAPVGTIVSGVSVSIIPIQEGTADPEILKTPLPPGRVGEIVVSGPNVTKAYDALPEATAAAKIIDKATDKVWHRMGDAGFVDETGNLWFCGRKAERVTTASGDLHTEPCERIFRQHSAVRRCALVGLGAPGTQVPALVVEAKPANAVAARKLADELFALARGHAHTRSIHRIYFHPAFPVDVRHNAKIHRLSLARWAGESGQAFEATEE